MGNVKGFWKKNYLKDYQKIEKTSPKLGNATFNHSTIFHAHQPQQS